MAMNLVKLPTGKPNLQLRVSKGHYATSHSHINYYIDVTLDEVPLIRGPRCCRRNWYAATAAPPLWTPSSVWTAPRSSAPAWAAS